MNTAIQTFRAPTGHDLTTITYKGEPCWIAQEVGVALGYSKGGSRLAEKFTREWSAETIEGVDFFKVVGEDLADLKCTLRLTHETGVSPIGSRTPNLLLLTREGFYLACMKTNKPIGVQLRRWLASEVLPALARGEGIPAADLPAPGRRDLVAEIRVRATLAKEMLNAGIITVEAYGELLRDGICQLRPESAQILATVGERGEDGGGDRARAAMVRVLDWMRTHEAALYDRGRPSRRRPSGGWLGVQNEDELAITLPALSEVLIGAGYSPIATRRSWMERGWTRGPVGRDGQAQRRIDGARAWVVAIDKSALDQVKE